MVFPDTKRIIYRKNPLDEVICQVRFPVILRIDSENPVEFQESIRGDYPTLGERSEISIATNIQPVISSDFLQAFSSQGNKKTFDFSSEDNLWTITLADHFLSLITPKYTRWEEFQEHFMKPLEALVRIYKPSYFSRIGLRYKDVITRSRLGLEGVEWNDLLNPSLIGVLGSENLKARVKKIASQVEIALGEMDASLRLSHGFVETSDTKEISYLIDSDFFKSTKTAIDEMLNTLVFFNKNASRLIRWSISDVLHNAMEPEDL